MRDSVAEVERNGRRRCVSARCLSLAKNGQNQNLSCRRGTRDRTERAVSGHPGLVIVGGCTGRPARVLVVRTWVLVVRAWMMMFRVSDAVGGERKEDGCRETVRADLQRK